MQFIVSSCKFYIYRLLSKIDTKQIVLLLTFLLMKTCCSFDTPCTYVCGNGGEWIEIVFGFGAHAKLELKLNQDDSISCIVIGKRDKWKMGSYKFFTSSQNKIKFVLFFLVGFVLRWQRQKKNFERHTNTLCIAVAIIIIIVISW